MQPVENYLDNKYYQYRWDNGRTKINPLNRKFVKRNLSDAIVQSVSDVAEADIDISELVDAIDNEPTKLIADGQTSETALNQLANDTVKV